MARMRECVINPFLGPRFKAAVVTTNMPLVPDKPIDFGLQDFCSKCKKCARECPSGAISMGDEKVIYNGYERWPMDSAKCTRYRVGNQLGAGCGVCLKVCPWNKPYTPFHRAVGWTMRHSSLARSCAIWGDDFMKYGKPHYEDKWWLDLEDHGWCLEGKHRAALAWGQPEVVVTLGGGEQCPDVHGAQRLEWDLPDPAGQPAEIIRGLRDEIESRVKLLIHTLCK